VAALPGRRARVFGGAAAAVATVLLLAVNQILIEGHLARQVEHELGADLPNATRGGDYVEARYGFWVALALAAAVTVYSCYELFREVRPKPPEASPEVSPNPP
jgi:hypothetical protein